jgi:hypothetical protein
MLHNMETSSLQERAPHSGSVTPQSPHASCTSISTSKSSDDPQATLSPQADSPATVPQLETVLALGANFPVVVGDPQPAPPPSCRLCYKTKPILKEGMFKHYCETCAAIRQRGYKRNLTLRDLRTVIDKYGTAVTVSNFIDLAVNLQMSRVHSTLRKGARASTEGNRNGVSPACPLRCPGGEQGGLDANIPSQKLQKGSGHPGSSKLCAQTTVDARHALALMHGNHVNGSCEGAMADARSKASTQTAATAVTAPFPTCCSGGAPNGLSEVSTPPAGHSPTSEGVLAGEQNSQSCQCTESNGKGMHSKRPRKHGTPSRVRKESIDLLKMDTGDKLAAETLAALCTQVCMHVDKPSLSHVFVCALHPRHAVHSAMCTPACNLYVTERLNSQQRCISTDVRCLPDKP